MSSPHMSFRLNHYQLAKMMRILVTLEPNQPIPSLSQAAKIIIIDWIAKHSINSTLLTSQADIDAIKLISKMSTNQIDPYSTIQNAMAYAKSQEQTPIQVIQAQQIKEKTTQQIQRDINDEKMLQDMKQATLAKQTLEKEQNFTSQETDIDNQIKLAEQSTERLNIKSSEYDDPNLSDAEISTVTDFSPPSDWME